MSLAAATPIDALCPVPEVSVLELAVTIVCARRPGIEPPGIVLELARWFHVDLAESDLSGSIRRLQHKAWLIGEGCGMRATEEARERAEFAARGVVHLVFRDRFFFDVGKLLDVSIVREDQRRDH